MKVSCIVLIYDNVEIIKRSLNSIMKYSDRLDIHVVENPSDYTEDYIKPAMLSLLDKGKISSYALFDVNIRNNATFIFMLKDPVNIWSSDYLLRTDGDIVADGDWLDNQLHILEKYSDVFCCSVKMSHKGWSQGLIDRFPKPKSENSDYIEINSGMWLCLFRTLEYKNVFDCFVENNLRTRDGPLIRYVYEYLKKKWVVDRKSISYELTRSGYSTPDYLNKKNIEIRNAGGNQEYWVNPEYSGFTIYENKAVRSFSVDDLSDNLLLARSENEDAKSDFLANKIRQGLVKVETLYFGINIKNIIRGKAFLGSSSSRSFYDRLTDTLHLRCNVQTAEKFPDLGGMLKTIVIFDAFSNLPPDRWGFIVRFCDKALRSDGVIRFSLPISQESLSKDCRLIKAFDDHSFYSPETDSYNENFDLPGANRYIKRVIFQVNRK